VVISGVHEFSYENHQVFFGICEKMTPKL